MPRLDDIAVVVLELQSIRHVDRSAGAKRSESHADEFIRVVLLFLTRPAAMDITVSPGLRHHHAVASSSFSGLLPTFHAFHDIGVITAITPNANPSHIPKASMPIGSAR